MMAAGAVFVDYRRNLTHPCRLFRLDVYRYQAQNKEGTPTGYPARPTEHPRGPATTILGHAASAQ